MKIAFLKQNAAYVMVAAGLMVGLGSTAMHAESIDDVSNYVRQELSRRGDSRYQELLGAYESQLRHINTFIEDFLNPALDGSAASFVNRLHEDMRNFENHVLNRARGDGNIANVYAKIEYLHREFT